MGKATIPKLIGSIAIDLVGMGTYAIPGIGEVADTIWAPISGVLIYLMYKNAGLAAVGFVEEILPGTDIIPTATIAWFLEKYHKIK